MKTVGKILVALGILIVVAVVAAYLLLSNLDGIVASAIEKYGSEATGTKVSVSSVKIKLREGKGTIRNLSVGNPAGFSAPDAFRLEDITVAVDTASVTKDPVIIDRVVVRAPQVTYEIDASGESNINRIRKNLETLQKPDKPKEKAPDEGGKKIVIRTLVIENGNVTVQAAALPGKPLSAAFPRVELKNLGGAGGDSPSAIAAQIVGPLANQASLAATRSGIGQYLGKEAEKLGLKEDDAAKAAEGAVRKLLGK